MPGEQPPIRGNIHIVIAPDNKVELPRPGRKGVVVPTFEASETMEAEKEELNWLLTSGVLGRTNNLTRMLTFICERHFEGRPEQVKEYTIAVEALGRRAEFDPQRDTIVRVTAHSLRKRLQEIYRNEGALRPVHVHIPPGHYFPSFVHVKSLHEGVHVKHSEEMSEELLSISGDATEPTVPYHSPAARWAAITAIFAGIFFLMAAISWGRRGLLKADGADLLSFHVDPLPVPANTARALLGDGRKRYVDRSGNTWTPGSYCTGANTVKVASQKIGGTEDPYLYIGGIRGIAHCIFPVKPGEYEMHFHFAETTDLQAATRPAGLSVNAGSEMQFDVVDEAGGDGIATSYVMTGVQPENDGSIHVDYTSEISPLNAIEILPAPDDKLLPVRITASPVSIIDGARQVWLSDRYFSGGRRGQLPNQARNMGRGIYSYDRIGRFQYTIPVVPGAKYRVNLYFSEPWFGQRNGAKGGPGSRIFDVSSNGSPILKNFDILGEGGANSVVKTFDNIQANPRGKIELTFMPVVNYPLINAIEVLPEP
jgi:hypothetical protein